MKKITNRSTKIMNKRANSFATLSLLLIVPAIVKLFNYIFAGSHDSALMEGFVFVAFFVSIAAAFVLVRLVAKSVLYMVAGHCVANCN